MMPIGVNHMTVPSASVDGLIELASTIGCVGIELRNDLAQDIFAHLSPEDIKDKAQSAGLRILALAEVKAFNDPQTNCLNAATNLMAQAVGCGAEGIALIPKVATAPLDRADQRLNLRSALNLLVPVLQDHDLKGFIEPLGFGNSTLRFKADVATVLDDMGAPDCLRLIHDTFHHHLASEQDFYPELTALVHVSGVVDPAPTVAQMADAHRVLVDADDRLNNISQLRTLVRGGYKNPVSFEAFAPETHALTDPAAALARSSQFISTQIALECA